MQSSGGSDSNQGRTHVVSSRHASHTVLVGRTEPATEEKLWGGCCSVSSSTLSDRGALQAKGIYSPALRWPKGCSELSVQMCFQSVTFRLPQALCSTSKVPWWSLCAAEGNRVAGPFFPMRAAHVHPIVPGRLSCSRRTLGQHSGCPR